jgi:hypothetical protein
MSMFLAVIQAVFALAVSLGLFGVGVYAFRRWGPQGLLKLTAKADRRMHLVETRSAGLCWCGWTPRST